MRKCSLVGSYLDPARYRVGSILPGDSFFLFQKSLTNTWNPISGSTALFFGIILFFTIIFLNQNSQKKFWLITANLEPF